MGECVVSIPTLDLSDDYYGDKKRTQHDSDSFSDEEEHAPDDFGDTKEHESDDFAGFVDYVLSLRGSSSICRFSLRCNNVENYPHIDKWIYTVIRGNVVELDLHFIESEVREEPFELPKSLFNCKSLVVLRLRLEPNYNAIPPSSD